MAGLMPEAADEASEKIGSLLEGGEFDEFIRSVGLVDASRANADGWDAAVRKVGGI